MWMAFEVVAAKPKAERKAAELPNQSSMRASSAEKIRRNPSADQKKVRRQMTKKSASQYKAGDVVSWTDRRGGKHRGVVVGVDTNPVSGYEMVDLYDEGDPDKMPYPVYPNQNPLTVVGSRRTAGGPYGNGDDQDWWDPEQDIYEESEEDEEDEEESEEKTGSARYDISDPTDIRPLHTRVAALHLKKG